MTTEMFLEYVAAANNTAVTEVSTEATSAASVDTTATADRWENFQNTLPIMGKGMLGIFIVTAVIVLTVTILNKVTNRKKKDDNQEG